MKQFFLLVLGIFFISMLKAQNVGSGETIQFDFKQLDFDTDRIIIEKTVETGQTSWLMYPTSRK